MRADGGRSHRSQTKPASSAQLPCSFPGTALDRHSYQQNAETRTMRRSVERPIGGCRLLGAGSHFYFALKERWQEGSREGEKKGREEEEQRERKVRGSGEREAGQQRSASAKQAKNNGQLEVEGPQLLKICSRDLAPKSRQLALSVTSLLA